MPPSPSPPSSSEHQAMWDTRAVSKPMAQPRTKEPKKIPMKEPMDVKRAVISKTSPPEYSSTDLWPGEMEGGREGGMEGGREGGREGREGRRKGGRALVRYKSLESRDNKIGVLIISVMWFAQVV